MLPVNFNQLYYFWAVARAGSISAAARGLLLNQSTVSQQMKQLEASLGARLLVRGRPGTVLTDAGRLAFEHCEGIFGRCEEMVASLRTGGAGRPAPLRLGVSQSVPRERVLAVARRLKEYAPKLPVKIVSRSSEELEARLEHHLLDLVISDLDLSVRMGRDWRSHLAFDVPLYFVASPRLKAAGGPFPRSLARIPLLLRATENPVRKAVDSYLGAHGIVAEVRAEVEDPELIRTMVLQGEGASVMDPAGIKTELRRGRLALLHARPVDVREKTWFICAQKPDPRPAVRAALESLMGRRSR